MVTVSNTTRVFLFLTFVALGLVWVLYSTVSSKDQTLDSNTASEGGSASTVVSQSYPQATKTDQSDGRSTTPTSSTSSAHQEDSDTKLPRTDSAEGVYIQVRDSCNHNYAGDDCLNVRSGPGTEYPVVEQLRNDMVLEVEAVAEGDKIDWYKVVFNQELRYPERIDEDWYVAAEFIEVFTAAKPVTRWEDEVATSTNKRIVINRDTETLHAYDGETLFLETPISTGVELTPTPSGTFTVFKKMPSRYMQGPIPSLPVQDEYDLPGVPWNLYFTESGAVIHGAYWHDNFGDAHSHGCVNLEPAAAERLYKWAVLGTQVVVKG